MYTVNTCESTIWNPLVISLDINLGYTYFFFPQKNELEKK